MRRRLPARTVAARRRLYATDAQREYLRRLLVQAFVRRITHGCNVDVHHMDRLTREYASTCISTLRALLQPKEPATNDACRQWAEFEADVRAAEREARKERN